MARKRRSKTTSPVIIGLTGSIGMGKSTVARMFAKLGVAVLDSDIVVHQLLSLGGKAVEPVAKAFPGTESKKSIDRAELGKQVFGNPAKLKRLEAIIHPFVWQAQRKFIAHMKRRGKKFVVLDIPLLFETGAEKRCDIVVVVTAPYFIQKQRVLPRARMTPEKFAHILTLQIPDNEKRKRADVIIQTGLGKAHSFRKVNGFLESIRHGKH